MSDIAPDAESASPTTIVSSPLALNPVDDHDRHPTNGTSTLNGTGTGSSSNPNFNNVPSRHQSAQHIKLADHLNRPHLKAHRTLSDALRAERSREEQETLLNDDDLADADGCLRDHGQPSGPRQVFYSDPNSALDTYYNIHRIRRLVLASIEDPYTMDQLKEPRMNVLIVKPLVDRLYDDEDISIGECTCRHVDKSPCDPLTSTHQYTASW